MSQDNQALSGEAPKASRRGLLLSLMGRGCCGAGHSGDREGYGACVGRVDEAGSPR
jgi:hypothetical protein